MTILFSQIQALQKELADANQSIANEVKKWEQRMVSLSESHQVDLQSSETILKDHRNTIAHLEDQNTELYSENARIKKCLAEKEAALTSAVARATDQENSMQEMLNDKEKSIEKFQMDIEVWEAQLNNERSLTSQLRTKESSLKLELSDKELEMKELKEQLKTKEDLLTKLNKDLMTKQKSLADLHVTVTRHSSDMEDWQRVCQEQSDKLLSMQLEVDEGREELVKTKSTISDLHHQLLQQSDRNTTVMQEHREEVRQLRCKHMFACMYLFHTDSHSHVRMHTCAYTQHKHIHTQTLTYTQRMHAHVHITHTYIHMHKLMYLHLTVS